MGNFKLISSKQIIAELFSDFNISNTDWVGKAQRHIARGLAIMEIDGYYERHYVIHDVKEYKTPLPCDSKYVIAVVLPESQFSRLPITNSMSLGINFKDVSLHNFYKGSINYNYLQTNFEEGKVMFVYYRIPLDDNGDLLIPDNDFILEALPYFVIYKLSLSGYKHPVISMDKAEAKWRELYPRAKNNANYPSIEERHQISLSYTNPIFCNMIDRDWNNIVNDSSLSIKEFIEELNLLRPTSTE